MGDPFLRKYYSVYDMDNSKIGLVGVGQSTRKYFKDNVGFPDGADDIVDVVADILGISEDDQALLEIVLGVAITIVLCILVYCCQYIL